MAMKVNYTLQEFILLGLSDRPELQIPLFVLFLLMYILILMGNLGMVALIRADPRLHTPMYFFLSNFSLADVCYSTVILPKMLVSFLSEGKAISFSGCVAQLYSFVVFGIVECYLLAVMAYDRYIAICKPLLYMVIMSKGVCAQLVSASYIIGFLCAAIYTGCTFGGSFCESNIINHYFCDMSPLLKLSCSETHSNEMAIFAFVGINGVGTIGITFISYFYILSTILRMHSAQSRSKAFNTCASHLMVVSLFYGAGFFMYLQPSSSHTGLDKVASVFYTVVTPMLNPLIYSLRNREVKDALRRMKKMFSHLLSSLKWCR
ncbi:olfactory receptor 8U9-like [Emydura macquarii macquarii]|uniref:olfactory receptor 8U9-like n=1 Tax=Emydura macquarii macquarii TaxID=1129001 RepID=UPI00352AD813